MKRTIFNSKQIFNLNSKTMKHLTFALLLSLAFISCKKHKEINTWEEYCGIYTPIQDESFTIYQDSVRQITISIKEVKIEDDGLIRFTPKVSGQPTANFKQNSVNENTNYKYQIRYSSLTLMVLQTTSSGNVEMANIQSPDESLFSNGRTFYITKTENTLTLTVINNGIVKDYLFSKK